MFKLTYLNIATIILDVSSIMLVLGILLQTRFMRQSGRRSDRLFFWMLFITVVMAVTDILGYLTEGIADPTLILVQYASMTVFYLALTVLVMIWLGYCSLRFKAQEKKEARVPRAVFIPGVLVLCLIIINLFTGWVFRIDETGAYYHGLLFIPMYVVFAFYLVIGFVYIGKYRAADRRALIPLWIYVVPIAVSLVVTFVIGEISMAALGTAITIVFTHLGTMNEVAEISTKESVS